MTITSQVQHSGKTYYATTNYNIFDWNGQRIPLVDPDAQRGVLILYRDGTKRWIGNSWFNDIEGLPPSKGDIFR